MSDLIDSAAGLVAGASLQTTRAKRDKVAAATQGSYDAIFDPVLPGLTLAERLLVAFDIASLSGVEPVAAQYRAQLEQFMLNEAERSVFTGGPTVLPEEPRLRAILTFSRTLTLAPVEGDREALLKLPAAGLSTPAVITLGQLIAFVSYQVRLVAGLRALTALGDPVPGEAELPVETNFVHPATLPPPGEPLRINGYTSETLGWSSWLDVLDVNTARPDQLAVLDASHPKARTSDYYLVLSHQPRILEQRALAFNAIMYAPGGMSRAERELASTVVSRVNGCVYCASVHAQRFEQLTRRNDVIAQVFTEPVGAGTNARERAIVDASIALTLKPGSFGADDLRALRAAGLSDLELLDMIHAIAIFAWANRLMLNLGEPVFPQQAAA
ncbi:CMD domain protein [Pigmentiphaga aceris]|uniref:CMD domain protein n=1 Tax=Pigmentiphaga aceris TaxID=1940612 RepID=A0A5C0ATN1_9BURK|nr:CMD domain protein [Pigmentiphaga aceris]QEI05004.1 CMD domain protein [Pigmentiphaga aceris]